MRAQGLWFDPQAQPRYTRQIEIDLDAVGWHIAGPRRPQDLLDYGDSARALQAVGLVRPARRPGCRAMPWRWPPSPAAPTPRTPRDGRRRAGGASKAREAPGLTVIDGIKTSLAPGSRVAVCYLAAAGLLPYLEKPWASARAGYGCTTCIGNPGPLTEPVRQAQRAGQAGHDHLSGNRNFPGRVHPDIELSFIMFTVPLVIAFGLAGDAARNLRLEPVQHLADGRPVFLVDLMPTREEVQAALALGLHPQDFGRDFARATLNPAWHALKAPEGPLFPWDARSTALRRPPFAAMSEGSQLGRYQAHPAAGGGRRHHHRYLAGQRHPARQPGGRFPGGARRRPG